MSRQDALDRLSKRLAADPTSKVFLPLAEEHRKAGDLNEAILVLREGLRHNAGYTAAQVALGRALLEKGDRKKARHLLARVVRDAPDNLLGQRLLMKAGGPLADDEAAIPALENVAALQANAFEAPGGGPPATSQWKPAGSPPAARAALDAAPALPDPPPPEPTVASGVLPDESWKEETTAHVIVVDEEPEPVDEVPTQQEQPGDPSQSLSADDEETPPATAEDESEPLLGAPPEPAEWEEIPEPGTPEPAGTETVDAPVGTDAESPGEEPVRFEEETHEIEVDAHGEQRSIDVQVAGSDEPVDHGVAAADEGAATDEESAASAEEISPPDADPFEQEVARESGAEALEAEAFEAALEDAEASDTGAASDEVDEPPTAESFASADEEPADHATDEVDEPPTAESFASADEEPSDHATDEVDEPPTAESFASADEEPSDHATDEMDEPSTAESFASADEEPSDPATDEMDEPSGAEPFLTEAVPDGVEDPSAASPEPLHGAAPPPWETDEEDEVPPAETSGSYDSGDQPPVWADDSTPSEPDYPEAGVWAPEPDGGMAPAEEAAGDNGLPKPYETLRLSMDDPRLVQEPGGSWGSIPDPASDPEFRDEVDRHVSDLTAASSGGGPAGGEDTQTPETDGEADAGPNGGESQASRQRRTLILARLYRRQGQLDQAAGVYRDLLDEDPGHIEARRELAELCGENLEEITDGDVVREAQSGPVPRATAETLEDTRRRQIAFLRSWLEHIRAEG